MDTGNNPFGYEPMSTNSGGGTTYGNVSTLTQPGRSDWWNDPAYGIDQFGKQAASMNAGRGGGGGGGGGGKAYNESYQSDPSGDLYDPLVKRGWINSPAFGLQQQKQAFDQSKWQAAFGALTGMLGSNPTTIGGGNTAKPEISVGGVFDPQQIDQQVNAARAKTDTSTATQQRAAADQAIGRGFGSNSPLIAALQTALAGQGIGTKAASETGIRQGAAQLNAQHVLGTQTERQNQWESENQLNIARAKPYFDRQNALIAALANIA